MDKMGWDCVDFLLAVIAFVDRSFVNEMLSMSVILVFVGLILFCFTNSQTEA